MKTNELFIQALEFSFQAHGWHGADLCQTLDEIPPTLADIGETRDGFTARQVLLHCAYWKYIPRKLLLSEQGIEFPLDFEDWPPPGFPYTWIEAREILVEQHRLLLGAVRDFPDENWDQTVPLKDFTFARLILGAAAHDAYHTGQIRSMYLNRPDLFGV